jgi:uncharacterized damage-inducible protein DinB
MEILAQLKKSFVYDDWANKELLQSLEQFSTERSLQLVSHIAATQKIWYTRLHHLDSAAIAVWPNLSLNECTEELQILHHQWEKLLNTLTMKDLYEIVTYRNTKGQEFKNSISDILFHVINHSTHHRAQVAAEIRKIGGTPPAMDYIVFCRK